MAEVLHHPDVAAMPHGRHRPRRWTGVALLLALGCGKGKPAETAPDLYERQGTRLLVPPGSPLRSRIKIEPATEQMIQSHLLAPASVEGDPARLARISPPLSGRVEKLFV